MKTGIIKQTSFSRLPLVGVVGALVLSACSAADMSGGFEEEAAEAEGHVEELEQPFLGTALCDLIDAAPDIPIGEHVIKNPQCEDNFYANLYYFGSSWADDYSAAIAEATYCAIADTGNKSAFSGFTSIVGRFGSESAVRTVSHDYDEHFVTQEHTGKIVVFGVGLPVNYSLTYWDFPFEFQQAQNKPAMKDTTSFFTPPGSTNPVVTHSYSPYTQSVPNAVGVYARQQTLSLDSWGIGGTGKFPVGPGFVSVSMDLRNKEGIRDYGNGRFSPAPPSWANYNNTVDPFNICVKKCQMAGGSFCEAGCGDPPTQNQKVNHELLCTNAWGGCSASYFRNLTDGVLPYSGTGSGARENIIFWDPIDNFWQWGLPGSTTTTGLGEKKYSVLNRPTETSTAFSLGIDAGFSMLLADISVSTDLTFDTRAGMALRSSSTNDPDGGPRANVNMKVDAEAAVNLSSGVKLNVNLPWVSNPVVDIRYDFLDRKGNGKAATRTVPGASYSWVPTQTGQNNLDTTACNKPAQSGEEQLLDGNPWNFIQDVAEASVDNIHPCQVKVCVPSVQGSLTGKLTTYKWDRAQRKLVPTPTNTACNVCDSDMKMCKDDGIAGSEGTVLPEYKRQKSLQCGGQGPVCGGQEACDTADDCSQASATCSAGCCVVVK